MKPQKKLKPGSVPSVFQWSSGEAKVMSFRQLRKLERDAREKVEKKAGESSVHQDVDVDVVEEETVVTALGDSVNKQEVNVVESSEITGYSHVG